MVKQFRQDTSQQQPAFHHPDASKDFMVNCYTADDIDKLLPEMYVILAERGSAIQTRIKERRVIVSIPSSSNMDFRDLTKPASSTRCISASPRASLPTTSIKVQYGTFVQDLLRSLRSTWSSVMSYALQTQ